MPKIFLIKNRLHQQQLRLQEAQGLLAKDDQGLCPGSPLDDGEPLPLLKDRRDRRDGKHHFHINISDQKWYYLSLLHLVIS